MQEDGWVKLLPSERFHFVQITAVNYTGIERGRFHTGLGKGLRIFSFPSFVVAPAAGVFAMLLTPSGCLSPGEEQTLLFKIL